MNKSKWFKFVLPIIVQVLIILTIVYYSLYLKLSDKGIYFLGENTYLVHIVETLPMLAFAYVVGKLGEKLIKKIEKMF